MTETDVSLRKLLVRAGSGDQAAFATFYDATVPIVYAMSMSAVGDAASAEALTAKIYLSAWRSAPAFDVAAGSPGAWLADLAGGWIEAADGSMDEPGDAGNRPSGLARTDA